jgi:hypothetical protein
MSDGSPSRDAALRAAFARLLAPLARLAVARGVPYAVLDEMLRGAIVASAHAAHPGLPPHRRVSRISAATGLNRREVARQLAEAELQSRRGAPPPPRTPAAAVFAHWRSDPAYRTRDGKPRVLPRSGPAPSFEALAHAVTRDVHPRALLEELLRLKLATLDAARDRVSLVGLDYIPRGDIERMAEWLGANVGDHFSAAVANVLADEPLHAEQAIAAQGLSAASARRVRTMLQTHWQRMTDELVPLLERLIAEDAQGAPGSNRHRVRIGLYGFDDVTADDPRPEVPHAAPRPAPVVPKKTRKVRP